MHKHSTLARAWNPPLLPALVFLLCTIQSAGVPLLYAQAEPPKQIGLTRVEVMARLAMPGAPGQAARYPSAPSEVERMVDLRGIAFQPTEADLNAFRTAGADEDLIAAIQKAGAARRSPPPQGENNISTASQSPTEVDEFLHLIAGAEARRDGRSQQVVDELTAALQDDPNNALIHLDLGAALWFSGPHASPHEKAGLEMAPAEAADPSLTAAREKAVEELQRALALDPSLAAAHYYLAVFLRAQNPRAAAAEYQETVRLEPKSKTSWLQLGRTLERLGDLDAAVSTYEQAIRLNPGDWLFHFALAQTLEKRGEHDDSLAQAREAARLDPSQPDPHLLAATILKEKGDAEAAEREEQTVRDLQAEPHSPKRIRLGGATVAARLISKTQPKYPKEAKKRGIEGTVWLEAVIGRDRHVAQAKVVSGDPILAEAALAAVQHWVYQPFLLSGQPLEVLTEIDVNFHLGR